MFTFWFPEKFHWLVPTIKIYYIQLATLYTLTIIQLSVLIKTLWSFKAIEKSKKTEWTWFLIIFYFIGPTIFIWYKVDEFKEKNSLMNQKQKI